MFETPLTFYFLVRRRSGRSLCAYRLRGLQDDRRTEQDYHAGSDGVGRVQP
jgi:hypothetical protein